MSYTREERLDIGKQIYNNEMSVQLREKEEREKRQQQSKNELITNVSHDLRSPLTSIIGYVELLKETGPKDRQRFA